MNDHVWSSARAAGIDRTAVRSLRDERIDWRFKGMPAEAFGMTVAEFLASRPTLSGSGFVSPLLVLEESALRHNLTTMADWCARHGLLLAPHGKTTMAPQLFERQIDHGAWAMTAADISQLRVYRAFGVDRVLLANQLVDPAGLTWLAGELDADPDFSVACWVDSVRGVRLMTEALRRPEPRRRVDVLVELGGQHGRTGCRTIAEAVEVAAAVAESPLLRLVGISGYEAPVAHGADDGELPAVDSYLTRMRDLAGELDRAGLFDETAEIILTAGGSAYFDQVAEALTREWPVGKPVLPVLRSGAYITHDDGLYRDISPFGREHRMAGGEQSLRPAMRIRSQVLSRPEPELALLSMGRRDVSFDQGLPVPLSRRDSAGLAHELPAARVSALADQHAFLSVRPDCELEVGDRVVCGLSHPCTVFDRWPLIPVVDGDEVVDLVRTFF